MLGEDLGSGILETCRDLKMDAKVRVSIDHSLHVIDGLFVNYMVAFERDSIDYVDIAQNSRSVLDRFLQELGLEFGEVEGTG
jgi:hypothetical protein